jgi:hypothetical protein
MRAWAWVPVLVLSACSEYDLTQAEDRNDPPGPQDTDEIPEPVEDTDTDEPVEDTDEPVVEGEPVSDAGPDETIDPLVNVMLDGTASYDPNGLTPLTYRWTLKTKPSGSTASLFNNTSPKPTFFADLAGDYVFDLVVTNSAGVKDSTPDSVTITAKPQDGFYVQMSWDSTPDIDLHLVNGSGAIFDSPNDCNYCNMNPSWGPAAGKDDPSLDWDSIYGYGPETITIDDPATSSFTVMAHYYGEDGYDYCYSTCPETTATVTIFFWGVEQASYTFDLDDQGQVMEVATIEWPSGNITDLNNLTSTSDTYCY